ncbi:hypothetical protein [Pseudomonas sp. W5-36]|uniref:hypothetical protein n=1 Tax=Pseudomonas sp. W5-36 TaxID=3097455 RepID=UPI00397856C9
MDYAYRSTGRDTVMSEDREKALLLALKAVINVARKQGLSLDELSEAAADELLMYRAYDAEHVPMAITEIEVATDALQT